MVLRRSAQRPRTLFPTTGCASAPRRPVERRPVRPGLPAADPAALSLHRRARGLRLPGPRRTDRRPRNALHRTQRQGLHPAALGIRLCRARHHGHAHHREQARAPGHHPCRAVHDVLGAAAHLHADHRGLHSQSPVAGRRHRPARPASCSASTPSASSPRC